MSNAFVADLESMLLDRERLAMRWEDKTSAVSRGEKDSCTQEMIAMAAAGARANVADVRGRESCSMRVAELEQQQQQLQAEADLRLQVEARLQAEVARANEAEARLAAEREPRSRLRTCLGANGVAMAVVREDMPEDLHLWLFGRESPAAVARRLRL